MPYKPRPTNAVKPPPPPPPPPPLVPNVLITVKVKGDDNG